MIGEYRNGQFIKYGEPNDPNLVQVPDLVEGDFIVHDFYGFRRWPIANRNILNKWGDLHENTSEELNPESALSLDTVFTTSDLVTSSNINPYSGDVAYRLTELGNNCISGNFFSVDSSDPQIIVAHGGFQIEQNVSVIIPDPLDEGIFPQIELTIPVWESDGSMVVIYFPRFYSISGSQTLLTDITIGDTTLNALENNGTINRAVGIIPTGSYSSIKLSNSLDLYSASGSSSKVLRIEGPLEITK